MTEELKQKAEEWCLNHTFADTDSAEGIRLQNAYIAGAEPREKRIADLEKKNAELKNRNAELKGMYAHSAREAGTYKQFFEQKEKENAELRHTIATLRQEKDNVSMHANAMEVVAKTRSDQLTKAKELLKEMIDTPVFNQIGGELYENEGYTELVEEIEHFLSEVEK